MRKKNSPGTITVNPHNTGLKVCRIILATAIFLVILIGLFTSFYTVADKEVAVVTTFGKVTSTNGAGVHYKFPFGIQRVKKVDTEAIHKVEIGYTSKSNGDSQTVEGESRMITGDYNIVNVDFYIEYKINDPKKYLYNSDSPEEILKMLAQSQIRNVIGSTGVDNVLSQGKEQIDIDIKEQVAKELEKYDIGISLASVKIQDCEAPTEEVRAAFKAASDANQNAQTLINNADAYVQQITFKSQAEVEKLMKNAEFVKLDRINQAKQEVAMFNAMYEQYALNKDMTKTRMYYETIEKILPGVKLYIDTSDNGTTKILPIESLLNSGDAKK